MLNSGGESTAAACLAFSTAINIRTVYEYQGLILHNAQSCIKGERQQLKEEIELLQ